MAQSPAHGAILIGCVVLGVGAMGIAPSAAPQHAAAGAPTDAGVRSVPSGASVADGGVASTSGSDAAVTTAASPSPEVAPTSGDAAVAPGLVAGEPIEVRRLRAATEFGEGMTAYRRGDFIAAAQHFERAYRELPDPAPLFNLARSWEAANDIQHALEAYERYVAVAGNAADRTAVLDRIQVLRTRPTEVFVSSEPPGAFVYVDEDPDPQRELTPLVLRLPPGSHVLVLDRDGYRRTVRRFLGRAGVTETFSVVLQPDPGRLAGNAPQRGRVDPRILNRRQSSLLSTRFSFLLAAARPWSGQPLALSIGAEAAVYLGRWIGAKVHFERVEPDGVWTLLTGDIGYVLAIEDIDLSLFAVAGVGYGWLDYATYLSHGALQAVPVAGFDAHVDWVFHPHLAIGMFFRALWQGLFVGRVDTLNSFGLSVSLLL